MRGISLDEIAAQTKISARNLRALEEEKFDQLPGGIFNKGFVRAYAKFLGIDEDQMVAEYVAASQETEDTREQKLKDEFSRTEFRKPKSDDRDISLEPKSQWGTIAAIVLIAVIAFGGWQVYQKKKAERARQSAQQAVQAPPSAELPPLTPPVVQNQAAAPATAPAAAQGAATNSTTTPAIPTQTSPGIQQAPSLESSNDQNAASTKDQPRPDRKTSDDTTSSPINVKLKLTQPSWVEIKSDGKTILSDNLPSGAERTITGHERVEMKLGNSGGVELTYNGKPVENVSRGQDVRKIIFTPSGYE